MNTYILTDTAFTTPGRYYLARLGGILLFCVMGSVMGWGQNDFSDDFESYAPGSLVAASSATWTTLNGDDGGAEDVPVSTALAFSGTQSVLFNGSSPQNLMLPFGGAVNSGQFQVSTQMYLGFGDNATLDFYSDANPNPISTPTYSLSIAGGTIDVNDADFNQVLSGVYPSGQWFEFKMLFDYDNTELTLWIDNMLWGTYDINVASVGALKFDGQGGYYIDDVNFTDSPGGAFTEYTSVADGDWDAPAIWDNGVVPPNPLPNGTTVNVDHLVTLQNEKTSQGNINIRSTGDLVLTARLTNSGTVTIDGADATLTNNFSFQGQNGTFNNNGGTLAGSSGLHTPGAFTNTGTIAPGGIGTIGFYLFDYDFGTSFTPGGTLQFDIQDEFDHDGLSGEESESGIPLEMDITSSTLEVVLGNGYEPAVGTEFFLISAELDPADAFAATDLPALSGGNTWEVDISASGLKLTVVNTLTEYTTIVDGNWDTPATWDNGVVPPNPIPNGITVNVDHAVTNQFGFDNAGTLNIRGSGNLTLNGSVFNTGTITIDGANATLMNDGFFEGVGGTFTNNGGTLAGTGSHIVGTLTSTGTIAPGGIGSVGTYEFRQTDLALGGTLHFDINGDFDGDELQVTDPNNSAEASIDVTGNTLEVVLGAGYDPSIGTEFYLIRGDIGGVTLPFAATNLPTLTGGRGWNIFIDGDWIVLGVINTLTEYNTIADGDWDDPAIWDNGVVPPDVIPASNTVNINHVVTVPSSGIGFDTEGTFNINAGGELINETTVQNSGTFTIAAGGTFTNDNEFFGAFGTLNNEGTLGGSGKHTPGTISSTGTIAPGGVGTVGTYEFEAADLALGGTLHFDINGELDHDEIQLTDPDFTTGSIDVTGQTLEVVLGGGYDPPVGTEFFLISAEVSVTLPFAATNLPALSGAKDWEVNNDGSSIWLTVVENILPVYNTVADGSWDNPATWENGAVPPEPIPAGVVVNLLHSVVIPAGLTVTSSAEVNVVFDNSVPNFTVQGTLINENGGQIDVESGSWLNFNTNGAVFENRGGATLNIEAGSQLITTSSLDPAQITIENTGVIANAGAILTYVTIDNLAGGQLSGAGNIQIQAGGTLANAGSLQVDSPGNIFNYGVFDNSTGSYTSDGPLRGSGTVFSGNTFNFTGLLIPGTAAGTAASLDFVGNIPAAGFGILFDLFGDGDNDLITVDGDVDLSSAYINGFLGNSYDPAIGASFTLLTATGTLTPPSFIGLPNLGCDKVWSYDFSGNQIVATVVPGVAADLVTPDGTVLSCAQPSLQLDASGSTGPGTLTYSWSAGGSGSSISVTTAGTYTVTVTSGSCTDVASVTVTGNSTPPTAEIDAATTQLDCTTSSISLDASSSTGQGTLSYLWSDNSTLPSLDATTAGTYSVTVTDDANNCEDVATIEITENTTAPTAQIDASPGTELSNTVTSITLDASGSTVQGTAGYEWSTLETTATIEVTTPGTYSVTVTDSANNCEDVESIVITESITEYNTIASGNWDNPATWENGNVPPEPIPAGVTVNLLHNISAAAGLTITNGGTIVRPASNFGSLFLGGSLINTAGGVIEMNSGGAIQLSQNSSYFENRSGGSLLLNGGVLVSTASIDPATVSIVNAGTITHAGTIISYSTVQNQSGGQISGTGNVALYTQGTFLNAGNLSLEDPSVLRKYGTLNNTGSFSSTGRIIGAGLQIHGPDFTHTDVLDINGETTGVPVTYEMIGNFTTGTWAVLLEFFGATETDLLTVDGDADLSNTIIYGYLRDGYTPQVGDAITLLTATGTITPASAYALEGVTCTGQWSVDIEGNAIVARYVEGLQAIVDTPDGTELSCDNPSLTLDASASTGATLYLYNWSSGENTAAIEATTPGTYTVTVSQNGGSCQDITSVTVTGNSTPPTAQIAPPATTQLDCTTSSITLDASGSTGQGTLSYLWSDNSTLPSLDATTAGTYSVTVTDDVNNCEDIATIEIIENTTVPTADIAASPGTELSNTVTSITLDASGSTVQGTASYAWSTLETTATIVVTTPGTYSVTVTDDANGCENTETITITQSITEYTSIANGDWTEPTTWENGNVPPLTIPANVTVNIFHGVRITDDLTITNEGTINRIINVSNNRLFIRGTLINAPGGLIYLESGVLLLDRSTSSLINQNGATIDMNGGGIWSDDTVDPATVSLQNAGDISGNGRLDIYTVFINEAGGMLDGDGGLNIYPDGELRNQGDLTIPASVQTIQVNGTLDNTGGNFTYPGRIYGSGTQISGTDFDHTGVLEVRAVTGNTATYTIVGDLIATQLQIQLELYGDAEFDAVAVSGTVDLSGTTLRGLPRNGYDPALGQSFTLVTGTGSATAGPISFNGLPCPKTWSAEAVGGDIVVTVVSQVEAAIDTPDGTVLSCDNPSLTLDAGASTGTASSYIYSWSTGQSSTSPTIAVTTPDTYTVTVTVNGGSCQDITSVTVTGNSTPPTAQIAPPATTQLDCTTNSITLDASGSTGQGTLSYLWSDNSTLPSLDATTAGTYSVTVTDDVNNCEDVATIEITENTTVPTADIAASPGTELSNTVTSITLDASGSTVQGTASYAWSTLETTATIEVTTPGTYSVTVTDDANGCEDMASVTITQAIATYTTIASGDWEDPIIWDGGSVPPQTIPAGVTVNVDHFVRWNLADPMTVEGTLNLRPNQGSYPDNGWIEYYGSALTNATGGRINFLAGNTYFSNYGSGGTLAVVNQDGAEINLESGGVFTASPSLDPANATFDNFGIITNSSTAGFSFLGQAINHAPTGVITGNGFYVVPAGATLTNNSDFLYTSPGGMLINGIFDNSSGTFTNTGGSIYGDGSYIEGPDFSFDNSILSPQGAGGNNASITIEGDLDYPSGVVFLDVTDPTEYETIEVIGSVDLQNVFISTIFPTAYDPPLGESYTFVTATGPITPGQVGLPFFGCDSGKEWEVDYTGGTVTATVVSGIAVVLDTPDGTDLSCANPALTLDASGSSGPGTLSYFWSTGENTASIEATTAMTYSVTVTSDASFCQKVASVTVTGSSVPPTATIAAGPTVLTCTTASITLDASGSSGQGTLSYLWTGGSTDATLTVTAPGTYEVEVTDSANDCTATASVTITENTTAPTADIAAPTTELTCTTVSITLDASGSSGQGTLSYLWTGGSTDATLTVTAPGTYEVEVTDAANGCTAMASVTITENTTAPTADIAAPTTELTCTTTSITLDASGSSGQGTLSYLWTGGSTDATLSVTAPGTYEVEVTDSANGCTATASVTITADADLPNAQITATGTELTCTTTTITLDASGSTGQGTLTYEWNDGSTLSSLEVTTPGIYTVEVTDSENDCTATASVTITENTTAPTADIAAPATELTCTTVSITLDASGSSGQGTLSYVWTGGSTDATLSVTTPGTYEVEVTDAANGCTATTSVTITESTTAPTADIAAPTTELTCTTTSITLDASGSTGQGTLSYLWTGGSTDATLTVTAPGTYEVEVTDATNGCTATASVTITADADLPNAQITPTATELTCTVTTITLDASGSTGQGTLSYEWNDGSTLPSLEVTAPGTYTVEVTDSENDCTATASVTITENTTAPTATITPETAEFDCTTSAILLDASGSTGQGSLSYEWNDGSTLSTLEITTAGTYSVEVTDAANGCTATTSVTVTGANNPPTAVIAPPPTTELTCTTPAITLDASGSTGQGTLSYVWSNGATGAILTVTTAGTYEVEVTDTENGCSDVASVTITENQTEPTAAIAASAMSLTCATSAITLNASGSNGQGALTYAWSTDATSPQITVTEPGTYTVTVTDTENGCTDTATKTITGNSTAPTASITASADELTCATTTVTLNAGNSIGQGVLSFAWSTGASTPVISVSAPATYAVTVTDDINGCVAVATFELTEDIVAPTAVIGTPITELTCSTTDLTLDATGSTGQGALSYAWSDGSTGATLSVTQPDVYSVTITDTDNGCTDIASITITQDITAPEADLAASATQLTCSLTTITLDATGSTGQGALSYAWSDASTGSTLAVAAPGIYSVTVTDTDNGCTDVASVTITQDITVPTAIIEPSATELTCTTTSVTLDAVSSSGQGVLAYEWSTGSTAVSIDVSVPDTYSVTVTDEVNDCIAVATFELTEDTTSPIAGIAAPSTVLTCVRTEITLNAGISVGQGNLSYAWSTGSDVAMLPVTEPGDYSVTVTDADNGCTDVANFIITRNITPPMAEVTAPTTELNCTDNVITLDATASDGQGNLSYAWSDESIGATLAVTEPGTYSVTVVDAFNGCEASASITITQDNTPPVATLTYPTTEINCNFSIINLLTSTSTGQGTLTYEWSDGSTGPNLEVFNPDTYSVTITDADNGCTDVAEVIITQNYNLPDIQIDAPSTELTCNQTSITLDASGTTGQGELTYEWTGGTEGPTLLVTEPGTYFVTVTDESNGCPNAESITITENLTNFAATITATATELTCEVTEIVLGVEVPTSTGELSYNWSDGSDNETLLVTEPGTYSVTIVDGVGCTGIESIEIDEDTTSPPAEIMAPVTELTCTNPEITLTVSSGAGSWEYLWNDLSTGSILSVSEPGTYNVTVTDPASGCFAVAQQVITENTTEPEASLEAPTTVLTCSVSEITLDASGSSGQGTLAYAWSNGSSAATLLVTTAGTYTVTVTDPTNGCTDIASTIITENLAGPLVELTTPVTELSCETMSITLVPVATGQGALTFAWSTGATSSSLAVSTPDIYTVTVTDAANGCSTIAEVTITQNTTNPTASITSPTDILTCATPTIILNAGSSTGDGTLTYLWNDGSTGPTLAVTEPATYSVTVTDTANGCTAMASKTVSENITAPIATIAPPATTEVTCDDPVITLDASGSSGNGTLTYAWSTGATTATLDVMAAGTYTVTVTDTENGCADMASIEITQSTDVPPANIAPSATELTCTTTEVTLDATAAGTYDYLWNDGTTSAVRTITTPGEYTVTVSDPDNGCFAVASQIITQNTTEPTVNITSESTELNCITPAVLLTADVVVGGTPSYLWSDGSTGATLSVVVPGDFSVTVTDGANGCTTVASATITENTIAPIAMLNLPAAELSCSDPSLTLDASGSTGQGTLSYRWNTNATGPTLTVNAPGTYTVTITDPVNGCTAIASSTITQNLAAPNAQITAATFDLCSEAAITLDASASTGMGSLSYLWTDGSVAATLAVSTPGVYGVTVTDSANGCTDVASVEITSFMVAITALQSELTCSVTSIDLTANPVGGSGNFSYAWSNGGTAPVSTVTAPGSYMVTITDVDASCMVTAEFAVTQNTAAPAAAITTPAGSQLNCALTALTLDAALSSGQGALSYVWNTGATGSQISVSAPGQYSVTVQDGNNGCTDVATVTVTQIDNAPVADIAAGETELTCDRTSLVLDAVGSTGNGTLTYAWSTGATEAQATVGQTGLYQVTVTDESTGCTDVAEITVTQNITAPTVSFTGTASELTCATTELTIFANATVTGTPSFLWSDGSTGSSLTIDEPGGYLVTVTDSGNGCSTVTGVNISQDIIPPTIEFTAPTLELTCANPEITLDLGASTGSGALSFVWEDGSTGTNRTVSEPGTYSVTATDQYNGCVSIETVTITENVTAPVAAITPPDVTELTCNVTSITLDASGSTGQGNLTYRWTGGSGGSMLTVSDPGTYFVQVTDEVNGCTAVTSVEITQDIAPPAIVLDAPSLELNCVFPSITIDAGGSTGSGELTYRWGDNTTGTTLTVTEPGTYSVTVTNEYSGCEETASVTIEEFGVAISALHTELTCIVPEIVLTTGISAGSGNFSYQWSNGATEANLPVTEPGLYAVTVTDTDNGCTVVDDFTITQNITPPVAAIAPPATTVLSCAVPTITLDAGISTGQETLSFAWSNFGSGSQHTIATPGTYTVTVTDSRNGCTATASQEITQIFDAPVAVAVAADSTLSCVNTPVILDASGSTSYYGSALEFGWSDGGSGVTTAVDTRGDYVLTVTDPFNGCVTTDIIPVDSFLVEIGSHPDSTILNCEVDEIRLVALPKAGSGNYAYRWDNGVTTEDRFITEANVTYGLTITDLENGCEATDEVIIEENYEEPEAVIFSPGTELTCIVPEITLEGPEPAPGEPYEYGYLWSTGEETRLITVDTVGIYELTVTNSTSQCKLVDMIEITTLTPNIVASTTELNCQTDAIDLEVTTEAGSGFFAYQWSTGTSGPELSVAAPGKYYVSVTDQVNGCTVVDSVEVVTFGVEVTAPTSVIGCETSEIELTATATAATDELTYAWTGGTTGSSLLVTEPGTYSVTVTNPATGCTVENVFVVEENLIEPSAVITGPGTELSCGSPTIVLTAATSIGSGELSYLWSDGSTGEDLEVSEPGFYAVTVTDVGSGCTDEDAVSITENLAELTATIAEPATTELNCVNATVTLTASGSGADDLSYAWSDGTEGTVLMVTEPGTYEVTVTDLATGCTGVDAVTITAFGGELTAAEDVLTCNLPQIDLDVTITGGSGNFTYTWTGGTAGATLGVTTPGTYALTVTDTDNNCSFTVDTTITQDIATPVAELADPAVTELDCTTGSTILDASPSTGTGEISYSWPDGSTEATLLITAPGTYEVTVTQSSNGCTATDAVTIEQAPGALTAELTASASVLTCGVPEIDIEATADNGSGFYEFVWSNGDITDAAQTITTPGTYIVTVTDVNGGCTDVASITITENTIAAPTELTFSAPELNCENESVLLDATPPGGAGDFSFEWNDGTAAATLSAVDPGTYTVTITNQVNGCVSVADTVLTQNITAPEVQIAAPVTELSCENESITLDAGGSVVTGAAAYLWSDGSTEASLAVVAEGLYRVTVTDQANGCSAEAEVTVTGSVTPIELVLDGTAEVCAEEMINISATADNIASWSWTGPADFSATTEAINIPAAANANSGTYTVTATNAEGCTATETFVVIVNDPPQLELSANGPLCLDATLELTEEVGQGVVYEWSGPDGFSSTEAAPTLANVSLAAAGTYTLVLTNADGCTAEGSIDVLVEEDPTAEIVSSAPVCEDVALDLSVSGGGIDEWTWTAPDGTTTYTGEAILIPFDQVQGGSYTVSGSNATGCVAEGTTAVAFAEEFDIESHFLVGSLACTGDELRMIDYSAIEATGLETSKFLWDFGNGQTSTDRDPVISYTDPGMYNVRLLVTNGDCSYLSIDKPVEVVQCRKFPDNEFIVAELFPTPNDGRFTVELELRDPSDLRIEVLDIAGRVLQTEFHRDVTRMRKAITIDAGSGMYFVRLHYPQGTTTLRTVVH